MWCDKHNREIDQSSGLCPECQKDQGIPLELELEDTVQESVTSATPAAEESAANPKRETSGDQPSELDATPLSLIHSKPTKKKPFPIFKIAIGLMALVVIWPYVFAKRQLPEIALASTYEDADPCEGKEACLICYLSPWCPACRRAVSTVQTLQDYYEDSDSIGFQVIVGGDSPEALEDYADSIGGLIYFDWDGEFKAAARFGGVPNLIHLDRDRRIIKQKGGLPVGGSDEELARFIEKRMRLPS